MYDRAIGLDSTTVADQPARKLALSASGIQEFLLDVLHGDLGLKHIDADSDFFAAGMDSLQAIKAQGIVKRNLDLGSGTLGQNAFFDFGNIKSLAQHLEKLRKGEQNEVENEIDIMTELIQKYSHFEKPTRDDPEVVVSSNTPSASTGPTS
jgi:acyl carrier protein